MTERPDPAEGMTVGKTYRIDFDDCCVHGWFIGTYRGIEWVPNAVGDPPNYPSHLVFDTGEVDSYGSWTAKEISGS